MAILSGPGVKKPPISAHRWCEYIAGFYTVEEATRGIVQILFTLFISSLCTNPIKCHTLALYSQVSLYSVVSLVLLFTTLYEDFQIHYKSAKTIVGRKVMRIPSEHIQSTQFICALNQ